jgi:hypothetical protein
MNFINRKILAKHKDSNFLPINPTNMVEYVKARKYVPTQQPPLSLIFTKEEKAFVNVRETLLELSGFAQKNEAATKDFLDNYTEVLVEACFFGDMDRSVFHEFLEKMCSVFFDINACFSLFARSDTQREYINDHLKHKELLSIISVLQDIQKRVAPHQVEFANQEQKEKYLLTDEFNAFIYFLRDVSSGFSAEEPVYRGAIVPETEISDYYDEIVPMIRKITAAYNLINAIIESEQKLFD